MPVVLSRRLIPWLLLIACCVTMVQVQAQTPDRAETQPRFGTRGQVEEIAGTLGTMGSDTMAGLMLRWGEALARRHPGIRLQLQASGSASAPPALVAGTTRLGPMSRPMSDVEHRAFVARHGYPPRELTVARDALVVVVHRHNPLAGLGRRELDAVFSDTQRCGAPGAIRDWQALGLDWPEGRIRLHGRNAASGTQALFRRVALCDGFFRPAVNEHPGSAAVVAAVAEDPRAIGYAGLNHLTPGVRAMAYRDDDGTLRAPDPEAVRRGDYALSRDLYLYLNLPPGEALPAPERAFIDLVLSPEGQAIVEELGFVALPEAQRRRQRRALALEVGG
ncbi:phosphate ABC transporter substrate-binding protein [Halomonas saccharevitans]|uniref:Phosphate ABC transporter substrate-binding protein n=1 Tax=Halomonas saccharevitans TaxID=416872 RepID=A0ABU3ND74_9GAMM|nr:phosphate ABC transporter substrate-binding protein [Halomonas saccharevitans]MDT8879121.1 phosphate ABC transporter substrate-binding protein [Halomonas saccharevitans]